MRSVIGFAILALVLADLAPKLAVSLGLHAAPVPRQQPSVEAAASHGPRSITMPRDWHGNFQVGGEVDGRRIDFIVDTGASFVALPEHEAARLGYHPAARDYTWPIQTANGVGRTAKVSLERVEVGGIVVRDVHASCCRTRR